MDEVQAPLVPDSERFATEPYPHAEILLRLKISCPPLRLKSYFCLPYCLNKRMPGLHPFLYHSSWDLARTKARNRGAAGNGPSEVRQSLSWHKAACPAPLRTSAGFEAAFLLLDPPQMCACVCWGCPQGDVCDDKSVRETIARGEGLRGRVYPEGTQGSRAKAGGTQSRFRLLAFPSG